MNPVSFAQRVSLQIMRAVAAAALFIVLGIRPGIAAADLRDVATFNIAPQTLNTALLRYTEQSGVQVTSPSELLAGKASAGVVGTFSASMALDKVLVGTQLAYLVIDPNTVVIKPRAAEEATAASGFTGVEPQAPADRLRLTQAEQGQVVGNASVERPEESAAKKQPVQLEQIVVTGSRLRQAATGSAVPVKLYDKQQIDSSGATTVAQFLNTLPDIGVQSTTTGNIQQYTGTTTVQLHGLPAGTTLVLVNGRRVESSTGVTASFFDLNQLPLAAVERIEVLPTGSSAIYGGDGLGGVVNVILRQGFSGVEIDARHGATGDGAYDESSYSLATGWKSDRWSLSVIGFYQDSGELSGNERSVTSTFDHIPDGGIDARSTYANPGNVCTTNGSNLTGLNASCAGIPQGSTGVGLTPAAFAGTAGIQNKTSLPSYSSYLAPGERMGAYAYGTFEATSSLQLFTELLYSHAEQHAYGNPPAATLSVPASNPYNPFGENVTVRYLFDGVGRKCYCGTTDYLRPLAGIRGSLPDDWDWELAAWTSIDSDNVPQLGGLQNTGAIGAALAAGTFNPFAAGPGASANVLGTFFAPVEQHYRGAMDSASGFVRGPLVRLPSGPVELVVGGEYEHDTLSTVITGSTPEDFRLSREVRAGFAEMKVPLIAAREHPEAGDMLSTNMAIRYDRYSDFGSRASPQFGLLFRPLRSVLLRAAYSTAFKPPSLYQASSPAVTYTTTVNDPLRGGTSVTPNYVIGGNGSLRAETGWSRTLGVMFSPVQLEGLELSATNWVIHINNGFVVPDTTELVNDPGAFPGRVTRAAPTPGDIYSAGVITSINASYANFGYIDEAGFDLDAHWKIKTAAGEFTPSLAVTQTYRYMFELSATTGPQNADSQANDNGSYAPRWKGVAALDWKGDLLQLGVDGRYTGKYRDVTDVTSHPRELGNFWYMDANARYELGQQVMPHAKYLSHTFVAAGVRNLFNKLPPYSDNDFGGRAYDANEYDLEGRFLWVSLAARL